MSNEVKNEAAVQPAKTKKHRRIFGDSYGRGTVSAGMILIVVAVVIILNLIVGQLPSHVLEADLSPEKLYEVSDTTKDFLKGLDHDIELILVEQEGAVDDRIQKFVSTYSELSGHLSMRQVDPVATPTILAEYDCKASQLIVHDLDNDRSNIIDFYGTNDAMILYELKDGAEEYSESAFDADGQITSAIYNLTTEATDTVYFLAGHAEAPVCDTLMADVRKLNVIVPDKTLDLLKDGIPEDCSMIVCNNPQYDLADDEYELLKDYLANGGDLFLIIEKEDLASFNKILEIYGMEIQKGYLGDQMYYYSQYYNYYQYFCFFANLSTEIEITAPIKTDVMLLYAHGMVKTDPVRDSIKSNRFMWTTASGFLDSDPEHLQSYSVGLQAFEDVEQEDGSTERANITVISCPYMFDKTVIDTFPNKGNAQVFVNTVAKSLSSVSGSVSIPAKSMTYSLNTMTNAGIWSLLFIGVIPVGIFTFGLIYWLKRRKR